MRLRLSLLFVVMGLAGCEVAIPNGLFACGQPSDCPTGYFCWSSDSRCYDTKEPPCQPKTCEEVIAELTATGFEVECGSLPDGCDGSIQCGECPAGTECGANGQKFACGCAENSCASFEGGAECGSIPARCGDGGAQDTISCGDCFGDYVCVDNRCVCPPGVDCDSGCPAGEPLYPCTKNECSPPGGLPDGCGGLANCPPCSNGEDCVLTEELRYDCVGECTCEAQGVECGTTTICGSPKLCGTCADNGFPAGYRCESNQCVCEDQFEPNDSFDTFSLVCGESIGFNCNQEAWQIEFSATLHDSNDIDYYALRVMHASTPMVAQVSNSLSEHVLYMAYLCPDGRDGMIDCSSSTDSIEDIKFCVADGNAIGILRRCDDDVSSGLGTLLVGVGSKELRNDCNPYRLSVRATYQVEAPVSF
ncbi:MAG TPA: hypothetical protein VLS88_02260 [Polyangiales bacterium]|nr:hypothetical protein [Polyangiales bacterium]